MEVGSAWVVLNLGVRFRQSRDGVWTEPSTLSGSRRVGFGLCSGTSSPYGSASPTYFLGVRTGADSWTRVNGYNWWESGWRLVSVAGATETVHASSDDGATLRVSEPSDAMSSAWYLRVTKLSALLARLDLFLPAGPDAPTEADFLRQMDRAVWSSYVNNHSSYAEFSIEVPLEEATLGALDAFNIFSDLPDFSGVLSGVEWLDVRAERVA